jgi:ribose/xylose/arabinose/galactoside ABC-type transport system permease subunit
MANYDDGIRRKAFVEMVLQNPPVRKISEYWKENPGLRQPLGVLIPLVIITTIFAVINPLVISEPNIFNILRQAAIIMVLGTGMTLVIATGGIDLSIGSIVGLAAVVAGLILDSSLSAFPVFFAIFAAISVGIACGVVNGAVINYFKVPPLIMTLGTLTTIRGITFFLMQDKIVRGFPDSFSFIGQGRIAGIPVPIIIGLTVLALGGYILSSTKTGKYMLAVGGNEEAAKRCGIKVTKYRLLAYIMSGGLAGLAGVMLASRIDSAQASLGGGLELHVVVVVIIGGTYLFGGYATMLGTLFGILLIGVIENGLLLVGVPFYWQQVVIGTLLIAAVAVQLYRFRSSSMGGQE